MMKDSSLPPHVLGQTRQEANEEVLPAQLELSMNE